MLLYKDGRFNAAGASFAIPNGFYVDTAPDFECHDGFVIEDPKHSYSIEIKLTTYDEASDVFLTKLMDDSSFTCLRDVQPVSTNGLSGHDVFYQTKKEQYYESQFDLSETSEGIIKLSVLVQTRSSGLGIRDVMESSEMESFLLNIRKEGA